MDFYNVYNQKYIEICKRSQKYPVFKMEVLTYDEFVLTDITNDVTIDSGSLTIQYQQGVRRTCSFSVINVNKKYLPNENSMFWYHRKFKIYTGLKDIATGDIYWFSQGVFFTQEISSELNITHITGVDKFGAFTEALGSSILDLEYQIEKGKLIYDVVNDIMNIDKGNGYCIDNKPLVMDYELREEIVPYDLSVGAGSYLGEILIELATILGADIFYNNDGLLCIQKGTRDFLYTTKASIWSFSVDTPEYISYTVSHDIANAINKVMVYGEGEDGTYNYIIATNDNPKSPVRISLVGTRQGENIETAMAYSIQRCRAYAEYYLNMKSIIQLSATIQCTYLPHLDVNQAIDIYDTYYSKDIVKHIISSITVPFVNSNYTISATNVALLPYYEEGVS